MTQPLRRADAARRRRTCSCIRPRSAPPPRPAFAQVHVLIAWRRAARWSDFWALRERRIAPFWHFLAAPPYRLRIRGEPGDRSGASRHRDAGVPRRDRGRREPAERDPAQAARRRCADGSRRSWRRSRRAAARCCKLSERARPFSAADPSASAPARRARSCGRTGTGSARSARSRSRTIATRTPCARRSRSSSISSSAAGRARTAPRCCADDDDAAFTRALIARARRRDGGASVALLRVDGRPIAAQVLLYGGGTAYTWKTAFDAEFAKFSPGALLIDKVTDALFAGGIAQVESCSADGSFMAAALDRPAHDGRPAGRCRRAQIVQFRAASRAASAATRGCAASATGCAHAWLAAAAAEKCRSHAG